MLNRMWTGFGLFVCLFSALVLGSCKPQRIISGNEVQIDEEQAFGLVQVNSTAGNCSGVLLNEVWVLTAGHCFLQNTRPQTATVSFQMKVRANDVVVVTRNTDAIYVMGHETDSAGKPTTRGYDTAFLHFSSPITPAPFKQKEIFDYFQALPSRASLQFFGHGFLDYYKPGPPPVPMKESAVFRKASLQISKILNHGLAPAPADRGPWPDTVTTVPNSAGQVCAPGDSGGPSFFFDGTDYRLAATTVSGDWDCADGTTYLTCKSTITNIKACRANRLDKRFTEEIIAASWNPNATTSTFVASAALYRLEAIYWDTSGADLVDPGARSWDVALRGASEMCYDRGFIGGHFTGKTPSTPAWEYVCSGSSAAYMDASSADILASGFNFTTLAVNWAQAYRAASTICATRFPSSVGGHFNGVATAGFSAPGTIPSTIGSIGLVCYLPPNERYLIPDVGRIFPHLKPDDYKWTTATQIAARICAERAL